MQNKYPMKYSAEELLRALFQNATQWSRSTQHQFNADQEAKSFGVELKFMRTMV
jgi:hypothetical protein